MTGTTTSDPMMTAISAAVTDGRDGNVVRARSQLLDLWKAIGINGDPLHRCTLAHYLADLYNDPAQALVWDIRSLDAADAITEQRVQQHHDSLHIDGFYPSLHLNLADNYRRLGSFEAASKHIASAHDHSSALQQDSYGESIRTAITEVSAAIGDHDSTTRNDLPGVSRTVVPATTVGMTEGDGSSGTGSWAFHR